MILRRLIVLFALVTWSVFPAPYVTCDIYGQLGNQLFQTATAIAYALDHNTEACFPTLRDAINGEINCRDVFHRLNLSPMPEGLDVYFHDHNLISIVDDHSVYAPIPDFGDRNVRLHAHFTCEKYFIKHEAEIRRLFAPTQEMTDRIREKYGDLLNGPTVAVHLRTFRTDGFKYIFNLCIDERFRWYYYKNAMDQFPSNYRFLVFSDDIAWTKRNFPTVGRTVTFIEGNSHTFDFYMMSLCDHQIVSHDSTYSWWAAWLNENPNKIVTIPNRANGIKNSYLLPDSWLKMPVAPGN